MIGEAVAAGVAGTLLALGRAVARTMVGVARRRALGPAAGSPAGAGARRWLDRPAHQRGLACLLGAGSATLVSAWLAPAGGGAALAAITVAARWREGRRQAAVDGDLPPLLESLAGRVRAGGSLGQAMVDASVPAGGVLADQWRRAVALVPALGAAGALDDWGRIAGRRSVRLAASALALAADTGGSPARAVDGVAATMRSRLALEGELRALTSQARASAAVIALAPLAFGLLAGATDPANLAFVRSPAGLVLASGGLFLDGVGAWWMARLCRGPGR